jgi:hypothetical protein
MAVTYPLTLPTTGISSVEFRTVNANATSQSPFTFKQQIISHGGEKFEATINLVSMKREDSSAWKAALVSLKGSLGTFLLGDPSCSTSRGTVSSCTLTGSAGDESGTVVMTGTLKAGDYIQLGSGSSAKLHQVLVDQDGDGTLELWPALRSDYTDATVVFNNPKGVFRLSNNVTSWSIDNASIYGISFEAVEAVT